MSTPELRPTPAIDQLPCRHLSIDVSYVAGAVTVHAVSTSYAAQTRADAAPHAIAAGAQSLIDAYTQRWPEGTPVVVHTDNAFCWEHLRLRDPVSRVVDRHPRVAERDARGQRRVFSAELFTSLTERRARVERSRTTALRRDLAAARRAPYAVRLMSPPQPAAKDLERQERLRRSPFGSRKTATV